MARQSLSCQGVGLEIIKVIIETGLNIGETVRDRDERDYLNWGVGVVTEISIRVVAGLVHLSYRVAFKQQGGYRREYTKQAVDDGRLIRTKEQPRRAKRKSIGG